MGNGEMVMDKVRWKAIIRVADTTGVGQSQDEEGDESSYQQLSCRFTVRILLPPTIIHRMGSPGITFTSRILTPRYRDKILPQL